MHRAGDTLIEAIPSAPADRRVKPRRRVLLVLLLSVLASVIPARSAAKLTIREALAYE